MFINDYLSAQHISLEIPQDINLKLNKILLAESPNDTPCGLFVKFVKDNKALLQEWMKENESELAKKNQFKKANNANYGTPQQRRKRWNVHEAHDK